MVELSGDGTAGVAVRWLDALPEDLRAFAAAKNWADAGAAVESYRQLEKLMGADKAGRGIVLPKDADDAEGWRAVHARLGCPDAPEDYALDLPDGADADDLVTEFRRLAHDLGLTMAQAKRLSGWWRGRLEAAVSAQAAERTAEATRQARSAEDALRDRWGGDYDQRRADAERARRRFLGGADAEALDDLAARPEVMAMLADVGAALGEDRFPGGGADTGFALAPDEARRELDALQRDKAFMAVFLDQDHPDHRRHVLRARRLNRLAAGLDPDV